MKRPFRWTLPKLRNEVWRRLRVEVTCIHLVETHRCSAHSEYGDGVIEMWVDAHTVDIRKAVVHEILHAILDPELQKFAIYHVYEYWITALETPFFSKMTEKEQGRWRRAIEKKTKRG